MKTNTYRKTVINVPKSLGNGAIKFTKFSFVLRKSTNFPPMNHVEYDTIHNKMIILVFCNFRFLENIKMISNYYCPVII